MPAVSSSVRPGAVQVDDATINKTRSQQLGRGSCTLSDTNVILDDCVEKERAQGPKSKRTRKPIDRLVVGDPKHFGHKSKGPRGGRA